MTTQAVGTYLYLVRDVVQKIRLNDVADYISTATGTPITSQQVRRIERGESTSMAILSAFADAIHADMKHVVILLDDASPTDAAIGAMVRAISSQYAQWIATSRKRSH
jgi:hypothetical protein